MLMSCTVNFTVFLVVATIGNVTVPRLKVCSIQCYFIACLVIVTLLIPYST